MYSRITPLILTFNEAPNVRRTLERLKWASRIVVLDSGSTDETLAILREYPRVECFQRAFDNHSNQNNYGLDLVSTEWVLTLDADYVLSEELVAELETLQPPAEIAGYFAAFRFCVYGRPVRGSLYPPRAVLFRCASGRYYQDGHTQRVALTGPSAQLTQVILHDDRKPLSAWLAAQARYAELEMAKLRSLPLAELSRADRLRRWIVPAPALVFFYTLLVKGVILDGWAGWFYVLQRTVAEMILSLRLLEANLAAGDRWPTGGARRMRPRRARWRKRFAAAAALLVMLMLAGFFWAPQVLRVEDSAAGAEIIVVLGGGGADRVPLALEVYQRRLAPKILLTGAGDGWENQRFLLANGVPGWNIVLENASRSTKENAEFSVRLLRSQAIRRVLLVTSWYHSRRALAVFRHFAPEMEFTCVSTNLHLRESGRPEWRFSPWLMYEYAKIGWYLVRYGIGP